MENTYFNSFLSKENYAIIRDEAYRKSLTIREHISNILSDYATNKRREDNESKNKIRKPK